jgi:hypothetical protein
VVPYTVIGPHKLPSFYHVYAEVILEFFLFLFWFSSFASMANYVGTVDWVQRVESSHTGGVDNSVVNGILDNIRQGISCFKAVTVFGALEL